MTAADDRFVFRAAFGRWQTNCYIIGDAATRRAVIVDPGETAEDVLPALVERLGITIEAILLTHGHIDHLWAVPHLARTFDTNVLLHAEDRWLWDNPAAAMFLPFSAMRSEYGLDWDPPTDRLETIADGQRITRASTTFRVSHTPGHTPGHVIYRLADPTAIRLAFDVAPDQCTQATLTAIPARSDTGDIVFSGDLLFAGSIGRTDLARGSFDEIMRSLVEDVLTLDDGTLILPGHGPATTMATERAVNQFLGEALRHQRYPR